MVVYITLTEATFDNFGKTQLQLLQNLEDVRALVMVYTEYFQLCTEGKSGNFVAVDSKLVIRKCMI